MRLSIRLNVSLVASVAVVSLGLALYQTNAQRRGLRREFERRALVVAESLEKSVAPLISGRLTELPALMEQFALRERLAGAAVYDNHSHPLAITSARALALASHAGGPDPQSAATSGQFFQFDGR